MVNWGWRTRQSKLIDWWWTIDHVILWIVLSLMVLGIVVSLSISPPAALDYEVEHYYFAQRHLIFTIFALVLMVGCSMLSPRAVWRWSTVLLVVSMILLVLTAIWGSEINGAKRWLNLHYVSIQPSELIKPAFLVISAWLLAKSAGAGSYNQVLFWRILSAILWLTLALLLFQQPDFGLTLLFSAVWLILLMISGIRLRVIIVLCGLAGLAIVLLIKAPNLLGLEHWYVLKRIAQFWSTLAQGDTECAKHLPSYQLCTSWEGFKNGGWFGQGLGGGEVKYDLPDAHGDFVLAVVGEELGAVGGLALVAVFAALMICGVARLLQRSDMFTFLGGSGLLLMICLQAFVNMGSAVGLLPTTGMTLPFISYGGSSLVSMGISVGFFLALNRKRFRNFDASGV